MKINDEDLIEAYYKGWEYSAKNEPFPSWFENNHKKIAFLLGYNDNTIGLNKEVSEILIEVYAIIK